ncbi:MAG TPA: sigma 54-interacting transcriptional regulator [Terriglobales bacterium]|nr:sigma 54-interacting transcriptional regulator [Terriglobales bacterium]
MMDEALEGASAFETFLASLSTRFTGLPGDRVDAEIERALRDLCEFLGTDRANVYEFSADGVSVAPTHSWARPPVEPYANPRFREEVPWYHAQLLRGETIRFEQLSDQLPADARGERDVVLAEGIKSLLTIPIAVGGQFVCALATAAFREHRTWSDATVARVRSVGQILASAIYRQRAEAQLLAQLAEIRQLQARLEAENTYLREEVAPAAGFADIVGRSPAIQTVLARVAQVAPTPTTVLLLGETGTGKELLARAIHDRSSRRSRTLVTVNCAALPPTLIESELFGHEKGAFTGATATRAGRFELADGGTLFLDEIAELPLELQPKLLRVLQDGEFQRVGGTRTYKVDVRIVAATNRDLVREIDEGRFREDLYYRVATFPIHVPPLRDRREDIPLLVWSIIERRQAALGHRIETVPKRVMDALMHYGWPGNVRELQNVIERALILSPGSALWLAEPLAASTRRTPDRLDEIEREHILRVLERCGWRINGRGNTAAVLGLEPSTLRSRMLKLGIRRPARPPAPDR